MALPDRWKKGPRPDTSVIELLDGLHSAAKRGLIRGVVVVTVNPLLEVESAHAGDMDNVKKHILVGGLHGAANSLISLK